MLTVFFKGIADNACKLTILSFPKTALPNCAIFGSGIAEND